MNEEIKEQLKSTIPWVIAAAIAVGAYCGIKNYRENEAASARACAVASGEIATLEAGLQSHGGEKSAGVIAMRLAKRYYDDGRYEEALAAYEDLAKRECDGFEGVAAVGKAASLEALGRNEDAKAAYAAFAAENKESYLFVTARLGELRLEGISGDRAAALKALAAMKEEYKDDLAIKARVEKTEDLVRRFASK